MKTFFIGIDPGKNGGIAWIDALDGVVHTMPFDEKKLIEVCADLYHTDSSSRTICCLEKVGARPGQGVVSMFNFGLNVGYIKGVLEAFRIPYQEITPQKWKKEFGLNSEKAKSTEVCRQLFPYIRLQATEKSQKPHDGMAEALLMAEYAKRKL